jgi:DNA mismatch repair protein MutL
MPIRILSPEVASQIAAGEVVERPASVVKELLENSLDAGAGYISVNVTGAGQQLIEVSDDGCGIPAEELALSVERHATSKLSQADDLFHITSLGFRGEALASIGSVSRMTLTSRVVDANLGARLRVEGGQVFTAQPIGASVGTTARVENLFYNVPARLKFMKSESTEKRLIDQLVTRYALAYPRVRFHLQQDQRAVLQTSGKGERREVLAALYGAEVARQMLEVLYEGDLLQIQGFISPTSITRGHRREMHFFVNGRPVQEIALSTALVKGYHTLLMVGRYPVATLFLEIPPEAVDVNVHPTKAEVRFRAPDQVFSNVQSAVRRALLAHNPVQDLGSHLSWGGVPTGEQPSGQIDLAWEMSASAPRYPIQPFETWEGEKTPEKPTTGLPAAIAPTQAGLPAQRTPILRPVGQVANAYLVAEGPDGLYLIDQHAAHERVLFERFMAQRGSTGPSQALLNPVTVELPAGSVRLLAEQLPLLAELGFQVEPFGPNTFLVRAVPSLLTNSNPEAALRSLVENFEEDETPLQQQVEARIIARICKRSAIKAGSPLSPDEQRALLLDLEHCQSPRTCPHGRPTMIHLSVDLLERQFGRRGPR